MRGGERFDVVHATAFPYAFPIACARRLARRVGAPFVLTPFLHLGDPDDPNDRTRRAYTQPALVEPEHRDHRDAPEPVESGQPRQVPPPSPAVRRPGQTVLEVASHCLAGWCG